jgi:hypothetical protein
MADSAVGAGSAPADALPSVPDLSALSADERKTWRETGAFPSQTSSPSRTPADSSPATPPVAAPSTEGRDTSASEAGTASAGEDLSSYKTKTAKRMQELLEENRSLKQVRDALLSPSARPEPPPVAPPAQPMGVQQFIAQVTPSEPVLAETQFYERFPEASVGDFVRYTTRYELATERATAAAEAQRDQKVSGWKQRATAAFNEDPEFWKTSVDPELVSLKPLELLGPHDQVTVGNLLGQELLESPLAPEIIRYLTEHPEEKAALAAFNTVPLMARAIGRLEATLGKRPSSSPQPVTPPSSSAPPPAQTVGSRRSTPVDESDDALIQGDFRRSRELMNARELSARASGKPH